MRHVHRGKKQYKNTKIQRQKKKAGIAGGRNKDNETGAQERLNAYPRMPYWLLK
jgi:hypothetical protein